MAVDLKKLHELRSVGLDENPSSGPIPEQLPVHATFVPIKLNISRIGPAFFWTDSTCLCALGSGGALDDDGNKNCRARPSVA
jgi:hypothetical protein